MKSSQLSEQRIISSKSLSVITSYTVYSQLPPSLLTDTCLAVDLLGCEIPPEVLDPERHEIRPDRRPPHQDLAPDARAGGAAGLGGVPAAARRAEEEAAFAAKFLNKKKREMSRRKLISIGGALRNKIMSCLSFKTNQI